MGKTDAKIPVKSTAKKIKNRLAHNFGWKIISLICSLILWMAIMNIDDPYVTTTIDKVPVRIINEYALQEQGKISEIENGKTVTVKVRAPRSVAEKLTVHDISAIADYHQMSLVHAVPIQVSVADTSAYIKEDITIESKHPEMMTLTLEDFAEETFRVDVNREGNAREGYYISEIATRPSLITVSGSKKQIDRIDRVIVDINCDEIWQNFQYVTNPKAYDKNGYLIDEATISFETERVTLDVSVLPVKKIPLVVQTEGEPSYGYQSTSTQFVPNEISVAGATADLKSISSLIIPFDISMQSGDVEAKINIETYLKEIYQDKYILVDEDKYVTVKVNIDKLPTKDIPVSSSDIEVRGLAPEYELLFTTKNEITMKVLGREEVLQDLTPESLKLYVDVSDYETGHHYVSVYSDTELDVTVRTGTIGIEIVDPLETVVPVPEEPDRED